MFHPCLESFPCPVHPGPHPRPFTAYVGGAKLGQPDPSQITAADRPHPELPWDPGLSLNSAVALTMPLSRHVSRCESYGHHEGVGGTEMFTIQIWCLAHSKYLAKAKSLAGAQSSAVGRDAPSRSLVLTDRQVHTPRAMVTAPCPRAPVSVT